MGDELLKHAVEFVSSILPKIEEYRAKNVNKYYREAEQEYREYTKMERYKNRVRVVDIFLPSLKTFLKESGVSIHSDEVEREIP